MTLIRVSGPVFNCDCLTRTSGRVRAAVSVRVAARCGWPAFAAATLDVGA